MFGRMKLQTKLSGSFFIMGFLVFVVVLFGWISNYRLTNHIQTLSYNTIPSIMGLWKINNGQTTIQSEYRLLINPIVNEDMREVSLASIRTAYDQINDGFSIYKNALKTKDEEVIYGKLQQEWNAWKSLADKNLETIKELDRIGIRNPWEKEVELISQGKANSPEMATVKKSLALSNQIIEDLRERKALFDAAETTIKSLLKLNEDVGVEAREAAAADANNASIWGMIWLILGPTSAL